MIKKAHVELHVHPNFEAYGLEAVVKAMDRNNLDVVALEYVINKPIFAEVQRYSSDLKNKGYRVDSDNIAIKIERDGKEFYILKGVEVSTQDNFHLITIGYDNVPNPPKPIRKIIDSALEKDALVIFDHPFVDVNWMTIPITKAKEEEVEKICKDYSGNIALEWNGYCLDLYWETGKRLLGLFGWKNVNEEVRISSKSLKRKGYNVPVVTDTDIHAGDAGALDEIGTARIISNIDLSSGRTIVNSLKQNIFSEKYENTYKNVSLKHFVPYFALPYIHQKLFGKSNS